MKTVQQWLELLNSPKPDAMARSIRFEVDADGKAKLDDIRSFCEALKTTPTWDGLHFGDNDIDDDGIELIVEALKYNGEVKLFNISDNKFTLRGAQNIRPGLFRVSSASSSSSATSNTSAESQGIKRPGIEDNFTIPAKRPRYFP